MKKIITCLFLLILTYNGFSQEKNGIYGRVLSFENPIINADVINFTSKKYTATNENGDFYIEAKPGDQLIIISSEYLDKKIYVSKNNFNQTITIIKLEAKPIELDDVKVRAKESVKNLVTYDDLAQIRIMRENSPLRNLAVYDGKIINGMDFIQIGKMIGKLFKSKKKKNKTNLANLNFKEYAQNNFTADFFVKTLQIKPEEVSLFLDYCSSDLKSKELIKTDDEFSILDFLVIKKNEFNKMLSDSKK